jgi:hypothetical protein
MCGSGGMASTILDISTKWSDQLDTSFTLPQTRKTCYPLDRRVGGCRSQSGCYGEEKISLPQLESIPGSPTHIPSLFWLLLCSNVDWYTVICPCLLLVLSELGTLEFHWIPKMFKVCRTYYEAVVGMYFGLGPDILALVSVEMTNQQTLPCVDR